MPARARRRAAAAVEAADVETARELAQAQEAYVRALEQAKVARAAVMRDALEHGWTMARVGDAMGLSHGRVWQLLRSPDGR